MTVFSMDGDDDDEDGGCVDDSCNFHSDLQNDSGWLHLGMMTPPGNYPYLFSTK